MFVITGATGTIGRVAVQLLHEAGQPVAAVTRSRESAGLPEGVRLVGGDPSRPASLAEGLAELGGLEAVLISPRAVGEATGELLELAARHGAKRVVVISAVTVEYGGGYERFAAGFRAVEQAAAGSGLPWTFLRCADFAANSLAWAPQIRATGVVRGAYPEATTSPIHERDVAAVAVRALTGAHPEDAGAAHALTGPAPLTQRDRVRIIGEAVGVPLDFVEVTPEAVRRAMLAQGVPADAPDRALGYQRTCVDHPGPTTDTVHRLLGRPALPFATWADDHAAVFRPQTA
ncbi:NmrA family transcriptional regulator [Streptacidiphilus pinicola]|uniref:NmrA family transcriptional regulator n=1 Tax=Streptacidiphilus pinicola TaxID=2219663 RepID=A0A2X0IFZ5_9ACTN|nr:NAD(P)H-binding protein [Streptacidiphilus pinicola]RAG83437.1 NmrA family transcriptional regulator [Streptacidiphilus pinicola]